MPPDHAPSAPMNTAAGTAFALAAYGLWGLMPAYWKQLAPIPAAELTAWRALCSATFGLALLVAMRRFGELARAVRDARAVPIALSAALLGVNWLVFNRDSRRFHPRRAALDARAFRRPTHHLRNRLSHRVACPVLLIALGLLACGSNPPITSCDPIGAATPLCGFQNPEDLALLPGDRHVIVSEYGDAGARPGRVSLLDLASGQHASLYAGGGPAGPGPWGAADCGPPSEAFSPHGIHLAKRADGALQLLVVQHGGRESVEMFEVLPANDASFAQRAQVSRSEPEASEDQQVGERSPSGWQLAWRGCAVPPEGGLNDVVALPEGGFLVTRFGPTSSTAFLFAALKATLFGGDTGWVYAWSREQGFSEVPGTRAPGPNGIELSADGEKIFLNATLGSEVLRIDRRTGAIEARAEVKQPDNLTWASDGRLRVASLRGAMRDLLSCNGIERGSCAMPFAIVALDPNTMAAEDVYVGGPATPSGAGTVGLEVDGALLIGTFAGDRIVRVDEQVR